MTTSDGTSMGIDAERALKTILGGEDAPGQEEEQTREQVRARLAAAPRLRDIHLRIEERMDGGVFGKVEVLYYQGKELNLGYGGCADVAARAVLDFLESHPEHADAPCEAEYAPGAWDKVRGGGDLKDFPKPIRLGCYDLMKENGYDMGLLGLTGFMWGFAYNTARRLRYEEGAPNPAIMDIGS